ncbi:MAG: Lrp/AsnC family transcriptional regulator [Chloroflexi bacterium]|nr:Lrp/AsnC family transcriptional regulator [Chloroflexota bacterium]
MTLDETDKRLVNLAQMEFPLVAEPFAALGMELGVDAAQAMHRIDRLKARGVLRYIGPLFDARSLGYQTTLVAARVAEHRMEEAGRVIGRHAGISHAYQREHHWNLWFTLAMASGADMRSEVRKLADALGAEAVVELPALKVFKLRAYFDATGGNAPGPQSDTTVSLSDGKAAELSPTDRAMINELQQDLPLVARPFDSMAARLGLDTDRFLACCQALLRRGIMRRYSAAVRHASLGLAANALVCWSAPSGRIEAAGRRLAALSEVSHCYERQTDPLWPYNLYAMMHGRTGEACQDIAAEVSHHCGLDGYVVLFSTQELKKARVRYVV